jgi:acetoacetyl-CoA reductase
MALPVSVEGRHDAPRLVRVALVTGGTGGIGTEICKRLTDDGRRVVATYLEAEEESARCWQEQLRADGYEVALVECDVTSFESCARMAREVESTVGPVDIVVNCAGITRDKTLAKMEPGQWRAVLNTNLDSAFNVTRQFVDGMAERGFGRIVSISSVNGQRGQFGQTNYAAAKAGLFGFSKALARELAADGVTVNTVSPGYVNTSMVQAIPAEIREAIVHKIPVGRLASPQEIARAVSFLTADESGYITGSNIAINGGLYMG